ncbi:MAG TPA: protease inhibitor I42 family protein [Smithella sp.]|nr:protease inhibitor I42 family protein [Smithella sp.]
MKKFTIIIFILVLALSASQSLAEGSKNAKVIKTRVGHEFTITQEANGTTGYQWLLARPLDRSALKLINSEYISGKNKPNRVGAPGKQVWHFKALKAGQTNIYFKYVREWEKNKPLQNEESYLVDIKQ